MAKKTLTDVAARSAKPKHKPYKLAAGGGLYLEVMPSGSKCWRWKYRFGAKEKRLALGIYPEASMAAARGGRDQAKALLRQGRDPSAERKADKARAVLDGANTFEGVAREWLEAQRRTMTASTFAKAERTLKATVFPWIGTRPVADLEAPEVLAVLKRIEARGANETAHRMRARMGQVFRYAIAHGVATRDPTADLRGALAPVVTRSHAAITDPAKVADLLRSIDGHAGQFATRCALKLAPMLFVRPGELRRAEWSEFDLDAAEWRIPAAKMKMREEHVVPLATQAVDILRELQPLTGRGKYLFPSLRSPKEPMSENTVNAALRRLGFDKDTMTGHGFRALASTRLNELGWKPDVIERQLAHAERNKVRAAYNRAHYMAERKEMMQAWADYLDALRAGKRKVVAIREKKAG